MNCFTLYLVFVCIIHLSQGQFYGQPEQIHLSLGVDPSVMVVTWSTHNSTKPTFARYGENIDNFTKVKATETKFVDGGPLKRVMYIYKAWMNNLAPGRKYVYQVGSDYGWSTVYHFKALRNDSSFQPQFVIIGDMGNSNAKSLARIQLETETGMYDTLLHIGDIAYDMDTNNARTGDEFMRQIEPIAANLPYMTCPGNHEWAYNFSNYKHRFTMPTDEFGLNMFYSIDIGPVHLISFSTEYIFFWNYGFWQFLYQHKWLERDLQKATTAEARAKRPWIVTIGHRPPYCSNKDDDDCTFFYSRIRTGLPYVHTLGYEDLFYKYGVDLSLWAHEHSYERLWPIYNYTVKNGSYEHPYTDPKGLVHVVTGSAGCWENHTEFHNKKPYWSAFRNSDYSYQRMKVFNSTHLYMELVSDDQHGKIVDRFFLIKNKHGPYK